jgi:hypothetical protein
MTSQSKNSRHAPAHTASFHDQPATVALAEAVELLRAITEERYSGKESPLYLARAFLARHGGES